MSPRDVWRPSCFLVDDILVDRNFLCSGCPCRWQIRRDGSTGFALRDATGGGVQPGSYLRPNRVSNSRGSRATDADGLTYGTARSPWQLSRFSVAKGASRAGIVSRASITDLKRLKESLRNRAGGPSADAAVDSRLTRGLWTMVSNLESVASPPFRSAMPQFLEGPSDPGTMTLSSVHNR